MKNSQGWNIFHMDELNNKCWLLNNKKTMKKLKVELKLYSFDELNTINH